MPVGGGWMIDSAGGRADLSGRGTYVEDVMSTLSKSVCSALVATAIVAVSAASGATAPGAAARTRNCFFVTQWRGWSAPSPDVLYLGVNLHDIYRVQLKVGSPQLKAPDVHLVSIARGGDTICDALDLNLSVSSGRNGFRETLIATSITKLTAAEVAAVPPRLRP
jgi:hypothetical protein